MSTEACLSPMIILSRFLNKGQTHVSLADTSSLMCRRRPNDIIKASLFPQTMLTLQFMQPVISRTYFAVIKWGSSRKKLYRISLNVPSFG